MNIKTVKQFLIKEIVLIIASIVAITSMFFVPPSQSYLEYIDFPVLSLLFCLMLVVAGFIKEGVFDVISAKLLNTTNDIKWISIALVLITFFSAMLVTNDVALITFVPLTIGLLEKKYPKQLAYIVVMETIAANLGSMMTPIGNPQNLYLYEHFKLQLGEFLSIVAPVGALSLLLIILPMLFRKSEIVSLGVKKSAQIHNQNHLFRYTILFLLALGTVLHFVNFGICLLSTIYVVWITDRKLFKNVDYSLLLTFVAFFLFVGNIGNMEQVRSFMEQFIRGKTFLSSVILSQIISNVPAAIMLSGFTNEVKELVLGVNIGGLGTLVASLASLISYKLYAKSENANVKKYILLFTGLNLTHLLTLYFVGMKICY